LQLNKEDKRFVPSYEVASELDGTSNLAAMDWLDFENLIRLRPEKLLEMIV
jgi:restriction system protein